MISVNFKPQIPLVANHGLLRRINVKTVLAITRSHSPTSRLEIARISGLSQAAVSRIVGHLMEQDLIHETSALPERRGVGGQTVMLQFNPAAGYVLAVEIGRKKQRVAITNLNGEIAAQQPVAAEARHGRDRLLSEIIDAAHELLQSSGIEQSKLVGTGITVTGLVDAKHGLVRAFSHEWEDFNLKEFFEGQFPCPAYVEDDTKAIALAEHQLGVGRGKKNLVCLCLTDAGPSAGIIDNDRILRGVTDSAGEVGSIALGYFYKERLPLWDSLATNQNVTFDQVLRTDAPVEAVRAAMARADGSHHPSEKLPLDHLTNAHIADAALSGDSLCQTVLSEYGELVAVLCLNIINLLNPEQIILHGEVFWTNNFVLDVVKAAVQRHILTIPAGVVEIVPSVLKENAVVLGGASLVLSDILSQPEVRRLPIVRQSRLHS